MINFADLGIIIASGQKAFDAISGCLLFLDPTMNEKAMRLKAAREISIFQTSEPRRISTKSQLLIVLLSLVSSLCLVLIEAEDNKMQVSAFYPKCQPAPRVAKR